MPSKKKPAQPTARKRVDWEAVHRDYRTGKFTLRELATKHGGTHQAIAKQAKTKAWTQDLGEQIRQATNAKLVAALVDKEVAKGGQEVATTVLVAAELNKQVILAQRARVAEATSVAMGMLSELQAASTRQDQLQELFEQLNDGLSGIELASAQAQFRDFMRLHSRIGSVHKLMDALAKAQTIERQAFALDDDDGKPPPADPIDWANLPAPEAEASYLKLVRGQ